MKMLWLAEYERLVTVFDDLMMQIELCERLVDTILVDVYRDGDLQASILIQTVAEIQADLLQQIYHVRLQKAIIARQIDGLHPFH